MPTIRQYWTLVAPRLTAASLSWGRRPSSAGVMTMTMSGIWK